MTPGSGVSSNQNILFADYKMISNNQQYKSSDYIDFSNNKTMIKACSNIYSYEMDLMNNLPNSAGLQCSGQ
jgi:hypothetical protein